MKLMELDVEMVENIAGISRDYSVDISVDMDSEGNVKEVWIRNAEI